MNSSVAMTSAEPGLSPGISALPPDDALRTVLHNEVHARPSPRVRLPALIVYVAVLNDGVTREAECAHLQRLPGQQDLAVESLSGNFVRLRFEGFSVKWERHTEFTRYSVVQSLPERAFLGAAEPEVLYLVSGEGDAYWRGEGGLRNQLEQEAAALGITDHVRFLGYYPDLKTVLYATDLLVSPSLLEGMQVSLIEAMAASRPIVATAIGGTPDAVIDGQTGLLVPPADASALASAVLTLLGDRSRLRNMGDAGRRRAEERFDVRVVAEQVLRVCNEVMGQS